MYRTVLVLTIVYFNPLVLTFEQDDYIVKQEFAKIDYYNKSTFEYFKVENVKPNRTYRAYTLSGRSLVDIDGDTLKVNLKGFRFSNNLFHHKMFDFDLKICDALRKDTLGLADILRGNLTYCPIKKGYYALNNYALVDEKLPPFLPGGRYKLRLTIFFNGSTIAKGFVFVEIIYKVKQ